MNHFKKYPKTVYTFGNEVSSNLFSDISVYSDMIDQVRNAVGTYQDYYIQSGERPDQVSQKLYDTPEYHWTFMLMNPKLRECGWPLSEREVYKKAQRDYYHKVVTTKTSLQDKFKVGQTVTGLSSGAVGEIGYRILDNGQIWFDNTIGNFIPGETATSIYRPDGNVAAITQSIVIESVEDQYNALHHYENSAGEWVDVDPAVGNTANYTEITYLENLRRANDDLKNIKVIRTGQIDVLAESFYEAINGWRKILKNIILNLLY